MAFVNILQLLVLGGSLLVELDNVLAANELVVVRGDEEQRSVNMGDAFEGFQQFDVKEVLLLDLVPEEVQQVLQDEPWDNAPVYSDLLDQLPKRRVGGVEHASCDFFAVLGLAQVEDDSR